MFEDKRVQCKNIDDATYEGITCDCKAVPMKKTFAQEVLQHSRDSPHLHPQTASFAQMTVKKMCAKCWCSRNPCA